MAFPAETERQRIYLAYREALTGTKARIRKKKAVRNVVSKHSSFGSLMSSPEVHQEVQILRTLLREGIFESQELAKKEFPKLFSTFSQENQLRKQDGVEDPAIEILKNHNTSLERPTKIECQETGNVPTCETSNEGRATSALHSLRFPFATQHRILSETQQLLEESCFNFTKKWLPSILKRYGWNCAAAGELTMWLRIIKRHAKSLPENCIDSRTHALLKNIAPKVAQLRHTAVHRLHLTPKELLCQLHSAYVLAEILQDVGTASKLQTVYIEVDTHAKKMVHTTETMQQEVKSTLFQIKKEREALVQREQQLLSHVAQQRIDIPRTAGEALVESVNALLATHKLEKSAERQSMISSNQNVVYTEHALIFEDDIESDEERLEAELRQS